MVTAISDQKYTLDNLIEFLKKHEDDANVKAVITQFTELQAEFNSITEKDAAVVASSDKSRKVLGGGKELVVTKEQYTKIVDKIHAIRNSYTAAK